MGMQGTLDGSFSIYLVLTLTPPNGPYIYVHGHDTIDAVRFDGVDGQSHPIVFLLVTDR